MVGLRSGSGPFFTFYVFMLVAAYVSLFLCYIIASIAPSSEVALSYFPICGLFILLYAGYAIYIPDMQSWQKAWAPCLSFYRFAFQGMVLNEFQNNSDLPDSHQYISDMGFDTISIQGCFAIIVLFLFAHAIGLYLVLKYVDFEER
jgi:ABC-type multidrug transport system permease subunit